MEYSDTTWGLGVLASLVIVGLMGALAVVGARRGGSGGTPAKVVAVGFGIYAVVFVLFMLSYRSWAGDPARPLILGLPAPTVWLLIGIFQLPWLLVVVLKSRFEQWTLGANELETFRGLVQGREASGSEGGP